MADKFIIQGRKPLNGIVEISGSKNAAGPILASTILTEEKVIIEDLPLVADILNVINLLKEIGAEVNWLSSKKVEICTKNIDPEKLDPEKISKTRISVLFIGSLLSRFKNFRIAHPGGDKIGVRPISTHLKGLEKLGVSISNSGNFYKFSAEKLEGSRIILKEFSVTATENLMMAACLAEGRTEIIGAAAEPHVQDLAKILNSMGANVSGAGTHTVVIEGVKEMHGTSHRIISDPIEAGTFIIIGCITKGELQIKNVDFSHLDLFLDKLEEMGVNFEKREDSIIVSYSPDLKAVKVQALPYPGFPTDLLPPITTLLTQATGKSLIHDPLYENRFGHLQELRKMGADIELVDPHRALVFGKNDLRGLKIESWDIRAGASLIIAALIAEGETDLRNISQVDRGYEKIEEKLRKIGADIKRVKD